MGRYTRFEWYDFCDRCAESLHMLWFNFILGLNFIFLCFKLTTSEQRKRIKLNHNIYIPRIVSWNEECLQLLNYFIIMGKLSLWACRKKYPSKPKL